MVFFLNNLYDFFYRYAHPKQKDKKKTTSESKEELKNDLADDLQRNIKLSFKSWLTKLESLRSSLLALGREQIGFIPFITLGVFKNYQYVNAYIDKNDIGMSFIMRFVKGKINPYIISSIYINIYLCMSSY